MQCKQVYIWLIWLAVLGLLSSSAVRAQALSDEQRRYKNAVRLVQSGDYERAKSDLNAIIQREGIFAPYAHYYYATAAFRQKKYEQARLMLLQLMNRFPDWRKMDDTRYLFAAVCMETNQPEDALNALQQITDPNLRADALKLEQHYVGRITNLDQLKQLSRTFPQDRTVGLALIDLIQRTSSDKDDLEFSDRLTNRFGVPTVPANKPATAPASTAPAPRPSAPATRPTRAKSAYNVAVMFPFRLDEFDADKRLRSNQYVYDLYEGLKLAKNKLQDEGITVNLMPYDVDNDANKALEIVNNASFTQTDLIIGPLYVEPNRVASAFANQHSILLLNPIATSSDLLTDQPMSFLAQPSLTRQARAMAEQARSVGTGKRAAVYFGTSRKDSLLATAYRDELKRMNIQIADFRKLSGTAQSMADAMKPTPGPVTPISSTVSTAATTSLHHIFFASSNDDDGARLLDALSRKRVAGPVLATATAFDFYRNSSSTFSRRNLYLLYPDFADTNREPVTEFQQEYLSRRNTIPSVFTCQGYDMLLFFGRQLAKNGGTTLNRRNLRSDTDDYLLSGFDYTQSNDNQIVPIVTYEEGRFKLANE